MADKKWNDDFIIEGYDLAKSGMVKKDIAQTFGVHIETLNSWIKKKPLFRNALRKGRLKFKKKDESGTIKFHEYVYNRLNDNLREIWDKINGLENEYNGVKRINDILENQGLNVRKHLFVYSLVASNFNPSEALRKIGTTRTTLNDWVKNDPDFASIIDEIHWHKKNFFEGALVKLVQEGNPSAVMFVNKCFNKDRGYSDKIDINVNTQSGESLITHQPVDQLNLSLATRKEILLEMRKKKKHDAEQSEIIE